MSKLGAISVAGCNEAGLTKTNQDFASCKKTKIGNIAAVSDGAGSAIHSDIGALCLVRTLIRAFEKTNSSLTLEQFRNTIIENIDIARDVLSRFARLYQLENNLNLFSATLVFAINTESNFYLAHLGDGACITFDEDDHMITVSLPENGEYSNETFFFTDDNWLAHLRFSELKDRVASFLVMTDGITPLALNNQGHFEPFTTPILKFIRKSKSLEAHNTITKTLSSDEVKKISFDDKSLAWWVSC